MKKYMTALLLAVTMMLTGTGISYAAFVVPRHSAVAVMPRSAAVPTAQPQRTKTSPAKQLPKIRRWHGGKTQMAAAVLCFFFGLLGIHRFYLGYTLIGFIQLGAFALALLISPYFLAAVGVWWIIEFIRILAMDLQPKGYKYSKTIYGHT